jgi:hypothetical protein
MSTAGDRRRLKLALVGAMAATAILWLAHVPGATVGMAHLGPAVLIILLLWLGRYPGERLLLALSSRPARTCKSQPVSTLAGRILLDMPRGGELLAARLASRAPPRRAGPC